MKIFIKHYRLYGSYIVLFLILHSENCLNYKQQIFWKGEKLICCKKFHQIVAKNSRNDKYLQVFWAHQRQSSSIDLDCVVLTISKNITCKYILSVALKIYRVFVIINNLRNVFFSAVAQVQHYQERKLLIMQDVPRLDSNIDN